MLARSSCKRCELSACEPFADSGCGRRPAEASCKVPCNPSSAVVSFTASSPFEGRRACSARVARKTARAKALRAVAAIVIAASRHMARYLRALRTRTAAAMMEVARLRERSAAVMVRRGARARMLPMRRRARARVALRTAARARAALVMVEAAAKHTTQLLGGVRSLADC